jgi:TIR domain
VESARDGVLFPDRASGLARENDRWGLNRLGRGAYCHIIPTNSSDVNSWVTLGVLVSSAPADSDRRPPTVFLSYASEDRKAARRLGDALPAYGLEVWYDESELGGGDAWDQKIRKQIRDCDYFMALISAQTEARHEGYFRREWRFAVERTLDMADDHMFLLPMAIDDTDQARARVPEKFLAVQWLRVPGGEPTPAFEALCRRLATGVTSEPPAARRPNARPTQAASTQAATAAPAVGASGDLPEFPREEPGQRTRFVFHVVGWALQTGWVYFKRLPRWLRLLAYVWLGVILLSKGCTSSSHHSTPPPELSSAEAKKLKAITEQYKGSSKADVAKLGEQIAHEFSDEKDGKPRHSPLLAVPFAASAGDVTGGKLADETFTQVYGRVMVSHSGQVGMAPLASHDLSLALDHARELHSLYVLWGTLDGEGAAQALTVKIIEVEDGSVEWSKSYPVASANPVTIAKDVDSHIPSLDDN